MALPRCLARSLGGWRWQWVHGWHENAMTAFCHTNNGIPPASRGRRGRSPLIVLQFIDFCAIISILGCSLSSLTMIECLWSTKRRQENSQCRKNRVGVARDSSRSLMADTHFAQSLIKKRPTSPRWSCNGRGEPESLAPSVEVLPYVTEFPSGQIRGPLQGKIQA